MDKPYTSYVVGDRSFVSFLKREIHNQLITAGFDTHKAGQIDIVVSELLSNLIKYAGEGEVLYRIGMRNGAPAIDFYCIDKGEGIDNVMKVLKDGYSSTNTLGHGFGSITRMSDHFHIYSQKRWGTVQFFSVDEKPETPAKKNFPQSAVLQVCAPGEVVCGDAALVKPTPFGFQVLMCDGLGHGQHAYDAAKEAMKVFMDSNEKDPAELIREMHQKVRRTRGLVATIAVADQVAKQWRICGVGNISTRLYEGIANKSYNAYNGIIGHNIPRTMNPSVLPYAVHQTLIMHSDGLRTRWNLNELRSIMKQDPTMIAASLYKDYVRGNDDTTVLVAKTT